MMVRLRVGVVLQHVHNESDKGVFLRGRGFGHQQGECGQAGIVDDGVPVCVEQAAVLVQEINKQEGAAALIAVGKGMVFHDKVEQMGGFAFDAGVGGRAEYALREIAENGG